MQLHEYMNHAAIIKKAIDKVIETKAAEEAIKDIVGYFLGGTISKEDLIESVKAECESAKKSLGDKETLSLIEQFVADVEKAIESHIVTKATLG